MLQKFLTLVVIILFKFTMANSQPTFFITNVTVQCISKTETKSNDLIYVSLISKNCGNKTTATLSFKDSTKKVFSEINLSDLTNTGSWCVGEKDRIRIMEKDNDDEDDIIFELSFTRTLLQQSKHSHKKVLVVGSYEISFDIVKIKLK